MQTRKFPSECAAFRTFRPVATALEPHRHAEEGIDAISRVRHAAIDAGIELKALGDLIREAGGQDDRRSA